MWNQHLSELIFWGKFFIPCSPDLLCQFRLFEEENTKYSDMERIQKVLSQNLPSVGIILINQRIICFSQRWQIDGEMRTDRTKKVQDNECEYFYVGPSKQYLHELMRERLNDVRKNKLHALGLAKHFLENFYVFSH